MKKFLIAAAAIAMLAGPAWASGCPTLMKKVDAALQTAQISDADKTKVMELRAKGEGEHTSGNHAGSVATLTDALKLMGM